MTSPPPLAVLGQLPGEKSPSIFKVGGRAKVEAKLSVQETVRNVTGRQLVLQVPIGFVEGGHGDLGVERLVRADVFGVQHWYDG